MENRGIIVLELSLKFCVKSTLFNLLCINKMFHLRVVKLFYFKITIFNTKIIKLTSNLIYLNSLFISSNSLTDSQLLNLIVKAPNISSISLPNCTKLTDVSISNISKYILNLHHLIIPGLPLISNLNDVIKFHHKITTIDLRNCVLLYYSDISYSAVNNATGHSLSQFFLKCTSLKNVLIGTTCVKVMNQKILQSRFTVPFPILPPFGIYIKSITRLFLDNVIFTGLPINDDFGEWIVLCFYKKCLINTRYRLYELGFSFCPIGSRTLTILEKYCKVLGLRKVHLEGCVFSASELKIVEQIDLKIISN